MSDLAKKIIPWYLANKRDLPWRNTKNPYFIWLSEVILQQTRIIQGLDYYKRFIREFPTVQALAKAPQDKVLKLWQGLGYYSRARNIHIAAKQIVELHHGHFPENYTDIIQLKGIGEYTAAAITSIAFQQPYAVVDGNVYRVLARVFNIKTPINSSQGKKQFQALANELLDHKNPAAHNQALMELGALVCKPTNPDCSSCPLELMCYARDKKKTNELPVKLNKIKVKDRFFNYLVIKSKNNIYLQKREGKDIWQGLFEFPLIETSKKTEQKNLLSNSSFLKLIGTQKYLIHFGTEPIKHVLSHQRIFTSFIVVLVNNKIDKQNLVKIKTSQFEKYAVPRVIDRFWKLYKNKIIAT